MFSFVSHVLSLVELAAVTRRVLLVGLLGMLTACVQQVPCGEDAVIGPVLPATSGPLYVASGDPYQLGSLQVQTIDVPACDAGSPVPMRIHAPTEEGNYAVVVFQHAFLSEALSYDTLLSHLASHGFIVVAPQMYAPGPRALLGDPTAAQEAQRAAEVLDWIDQQLASVSGVAARTEVVLGLAGHSRGGKVAWLLLAGDPSRALSIAGVDPVDGTGGPLGNQPRVVQGTFSFEVPSLVIGTGLGGACAPAGDNHEQFYAASPGPAWHIVAEDFGHGDMLDEDAARMAGMVCSGGPDRDTARRLTAGWLTAFFRATLQGDDGGFDRLADVPAQRPVTIEVK